MSNSAMTATAPSTPIEQRDPHRADTPRTWTFTDKETGQPRNVVCLPGCTISHVADIETPSYPVDVFCWNQSDRAAVTLPIDTSGEPEEYRVLNAFIEANPFSAEISRRLPFAVIEVIDEHWITPLDPDGLQTVINLLAGQVEQLRRVHTELVRLRREHMAREARIDGWVDQALGALRQEKPEATA